MRQLKFPEYEYIKSLPKICTKSEYNYEIGLPLEYEWKLFDTPVNVRGTLSYNEDGSGYICFDVWEDGYTGQNDLGLAVKLNKANYKKLCKHAQIIFNSFIEALDRDCSYTWVDYLSEVK
jgi:hypothetical protein